MIFVTVGTQIPFDRLIKAMDEIAPALEGEEIVAQSCNGSYVPRNFSTVRFLSPDRFEELMKQARIVVAHAGIGTILTAMKNQIPLVVVARKAEFHEHRNDHQRATAKFFASLYNVATADSTDRLLEQIKKAPVPSPLNPHPDRSLISAIADVIDSKR